LTTSDGAPVGGNIRTPRKLRDVKPVYPSTLAETPGQAVLRARVTPDGTVDSIEVVSATHPEFADATMAAVSQWLFDATVLNCEPVAVQMQVTANYTVQK
jgi:TonB family protein